MAQQAFSNKPALPIWALMASITASMAPPLLANSLFSSNKTNGDIKHGELPRTIGDAKADNGPAGLLRYAIGFDMRPHGRHHCIDGASPPSQHTILA